MEINILSTKTGLYFFWLMKFFRCPNHYTCLQNDLATDLYPLFCNLENCFAYTTYPWITLLLLWLYGTLELLEWYVYIGKDLCCCSKLTLYLLAHWWWEVLFLKEAVLSRPLHKKWSFPLWISSVNVTKSAVFCRFGHIYWRNN